MGNLSDVARSQGDVMQRLKALEIEVARIKTSRRLESASIGSGGLRLIGGDITLDEGGNIVITNGILTAGDPDGLRAQVTSGGYQVFNEDDELTIDLTTLGQNQLLIRAGGKEENTIHLANDGSINGKILNVERIVMDGQDLGELLVGNEIIDPEPTGGGGVGGTITYEADWSQSYKSNNQPNDFAGGLNQGRYSSLNGNQRSLIGFPSSQIQSDHAGRTVTRVRVFLYYKHWYFNSGGTAILGHHGHSNEPGSFSASATDVVRSDDWPKPGGRWVRYEHSMQQWVTGAKRGIALGPGPSSSRVYYGTAHRHNQSRPPRLEIRSQ